MTVETQEWLAPMLVALLVSDDGSGSLARLMEAIATAAAIEAILKAVPIGASGPNWIRLGQLVREDLGWHDYPPSPNDAMN